MKIATKAMQYTYQAFKLADGIDLVRYKSAHNADLLTSSSMHLFYEVDDLKYVYLMNYGVVVFCNLDESHVNLYRKNLVPYLKGPHHQEFEDKLSVNLVDGNPLHIEFHQITMNNINDERNKIIMLNLAQSVALDYYMQHSQTLLSQLKDYTQKLNDSGKVSLNEKQSLKYMGMSLKIKNEIAENLYILDSPEKTWEDEYIDHLNIRLADHLELRLRFHAIENTIKIIEDNLHVFMSYNQHRESSRLEWIIIILIVIEVVDTFVAKLF